MGTTVLLSQLSATTELLVINLVTQQDPESDPQLACRCYFRFPQTFLHQLVLKKRCNSASLRTACPTASHHRKRRNGFPCLLKPPNRCRPPLECSLGISPT